MDTKIEFRVFTDGKYVYSVGHFLQKFSFYKDKLGIKFADGSKKFEPLEKVERFTGLIDKNNRWIYEGDIFTWGKKSENYKVVFHKASFGFWEYGEFFMLYSYLMNGEVIGNTYENPELLKS